MAAHEHETQDDITAATSVYRWPHVAMGCFELQAVEEAYNANPYHNSMHAADVTQSLGVMFLSESFTSQLTSLELLSMLLSALVHDVGHPGKFFLPEPVHLHRCSWLGAGLDGALQSI